MNPTFRWVRRGGVVAVALLLGWIAFGDAWRDADRRFSPDVPVGLALSAALATITMAAGTRYFAAAMWFAIAAIAQAAALRLVDAGPDLHYQHYPPIDVMWSSDPWALLTVAAQTAVVVSGWIWNARRRAPSTPSVSTARTVLALVLSLSTAATVSPSVWRYVSELGFAAAVQALAIATIVLMVRALPESAASTAERLVAPITEGRRAASFTWSAAAVATIVAAMLGAFSYDWHPHVPDEVPYLFHARYFAAGMLTMPAPPVPDAFDVDLMFYEPTRWYSPVPPGWPAMLSLGALFGLPWIVNPILTGVCAILTHRLLREIYDDRIAAYATMLFVASPWVLFLGMSLMTHMFTLTAALVAALGVVHARRTGSFRWGLASGAGIGATSLVRPLDGLIVGVLVGVWAIGVGGARLRRWPLAGLVAGAAIVGAFQAPYNWWLTGDPFRFPINAHTDRYNSLNSNAYGFGPDRGMGWAIDPNPGHSPLDGLININLNAFGLNTDLFGWSTGSLIVVAWLIVSGRIGRADWLMLGTIAGIVGVYFPYYFSGGPDFGARYWFPVVVPLVALTARGIRELEARTGARVLVAVAALVVLSCVNFVPWRAIDKYRDFRGMRADIPGLAERHGFGRDLVLVRGPRFPDYASAIVYNPIDLSASETIYAWDRSPEARRAVIDAFPGRRVWLVDGPSITGGAYAVREGPVPAESIVSQPTGRD